MSSKLKLYIDYPFEIWIDSVFHSIARTGEPNIIILPCGVYLIEFKDDGRTQARKVIKIEVDNFEYLEVYSLIKDDSRFSIHENIYYSLGTYSFALGPRLGLWSEDNYALTKPIYYNIRTLGYGLMCDVHGEIHGVDDLYEVQNDSNKLGILGPTGIELLKCEYDELKRIYRNIPNTRLFIEFLFYVKNKSVGELLSKYNKWFPNSLEQLKDVQSAINMLPVFWFAVAKQGERFGVIGLDNEIFVPFFFEDCEFIGSDDIFCNTYEQIPSSEEDTQLTRKGAYPLHFKVKLNNMWGIFQWNPICKSKMLTEIVYDDCDFVPNGLMVVKGEKAALLDFNGTFITEFEDKSNWWVFYY